jgi:hypothetical protein
MPGWGGSQENAGDDRQRTPRRKIRIQFLGHKHTSLISLVGESSEVRLYSVTKTILVTFAVTFEGRSFGRVVR